MTFVDICSASHLGNFAANWLDSWRGASSSVSNLSCGRARWAESYRHMFDPRDRVGIQPLHGACDFEVWQPVQHLVEHHLQFQTGEVGSQAEMLAVAEGDVLVGRTLDVEPIGLRKLSLVTVGRRVPNHHAISRL